MQQTIKIHESDNVAVAVRPLRADTRIADSFPAVVTASEIPRGHKIALADLEIGQPIIKYGFTIGRTTQKICSGDWIHTHNLETTLGQNVEYQYCPSNANDHLRSGVVTPPSGDLRSEDAPTRREFYGYRRADGKTGTRNEIWIINTVACVNNAAERIARVAHEQFAAGNIDGIYAFPHPYGCSQLGDDLKATQKVLAGLLNHPNAGAVLVLGLGCENNAIKYFVNEIGGFNPERVKFLNAQDVEDEVEEGLKLVAELAMHAGTFQREPRPLADLVVILSGAKTLGQSTDELLDFILRVASGEVRTKNELNGFREITIFKTGVTL